MEAGDQPLDGGDTIEGRTPPRRVEAAPLGQLAAGFPNPVDRSVGVAAAECWSARPPKRATQSLGWILECVLQPRAEGPLVQPIRLRLGQHRKERIDAGLD